MNVRDCQEFKPRELCHCPRLPFPDPLAPPWPSGSTQGAGTPRGEDDPMDDHMGDTGAADEAVIAKVG